ncbi:MAG: extracellular solute-binding protein, partial [Pirellulales bacterium]|nr:extracellular solute-binding protein [Pirellulales bacterium]
ELAREFMRQNPTINVEVTDYFNNQIDPFSPGYTEPRTLYQGANCFLHKTQGSDAGALREFVIPITPLMEIDPEMSVDDYFPAALTPFTVDGVLYAVPATSFPSVIIYDRDRFVEFDVAEPSLEWTLDDFLATARGLTNVNADGEQVYGFAPLYYDTPGNPLVQFGIPLIDNSASPPTLNLRNAERAYRWYIDLIRVHQVQPLLTPAIFGASLSGFDANREEFFQLKDNAQIAMWPARHMNRGPEIADTPELMTRIPDGQALERANLVLMPLPVGPSGYSGSAPGAAGYFIAAASSSEQRDACWQWIKYLTRQRAAAEGVPTRIDVFESDAYREEVGQRAHDVFRLALESAHVPQNSLYDLPEWMGFGTSPLHTVYQQVAAGEADLLEELDRLQVRFDEYRSCLIERDAFLTDDFHEVDPLIRYECAMLVDPERGQLLRPKDLTQ